MWCHMKNKKQLRRTRIEALVVLLGVAGYIWVGLDVPLYYRMPGVPGPSVFPVVLGIIMAAAALWLLIFPGEEEKPPKGAPEQSAWRDFEGRWQFYLMWGLLIAYVFLLPGLGFVVSSALLLIAFFFLLGERRWYLAIPIAVVFTLAIYIGFARGLQIRLPPGILASVLR